MLQLHCKYKEHDMVRRESISLQKQPASRQLGRPSDRQRSIFIGTHRPWHRSFLSRTHRKDALCRLQIFLKVNTFRTRQILLCGFCLYVVRSVFKWKPQNFLSKVNVFKNHFILLNEYNNYVPLLHAHLVLSGKNSRKFLQNTLNLFLTRYTRSMQAASWQLLVVSIPFMFHWQPFLKSLGRFSCLC